MLGSHTTSLEQLVLINFERVEFAGETVEVPHHQLGAVLINFERV